MWFNYLLLKEIFVKMVLCNNFKALYIDHLLCIINNMNFWMKVFLGTILRCVF